MRPNNLGLVKFLQLTSVRVVVQIALSIIVFHYPGHVVTQMQANNINSIEHDQVGGYNNNQPNVSHKPIPCGTIATNHTHITVKNPHHPEPTYVKAICETVVERTHTNINRLNIKFKQLELYRPNYDGSCLHDKFAVYTDLNIAVSPVLCGNHTGRAISIPFTPPLTSLIVSITTSDLDHDRAWELEIEQG